MNGKRKKWYSIVTSFLLILVLAATGVVFAETGDIKLNTSGNPEEGKYTVTEFVDENGETAKITTDNPYTEWMGKDDDEETDDKSFTEILIGTLAANVYGVSGTLRFGGYWEQPHYCTAEGRTSKAYCVEPDVVNLTTYEATTSHEDDPVICSILYYGYGGDGNILGNSDEAFFATWNCIRKRINASAGPETSMTDTLWNHAVANPLPAGSYYIRFSDPTIQDVIGCLYKAPDVGNISFQKYDENGNALSGGSYRLTGNGVDTTITSPQTITGLNPGSYTITETEAPNGYVMASQSTCVTVVAGSTVNASLSNKKQVADIKVMKYDAETDKDTQGDATLAGAEFEVHKGSADGTIVGTLTTDADGNTGTIEDQDLDTYYVIEKKAPEGYNADSTPIVVDRTWKVSTQTKEALDEPVVVKDTVKKGSVHIQKYYHDTGSTLTTLSGIEYTLTLNSKPTKTYSETTDSKGELTFTDIPYGEYTLHEVVTTLPSHVTHMDDMTITVLQDGLQLDYYVNDDRVRAEITIVKKDSEDHALVAVSGTKFKIIDLNGTANTFVEQTNKKKKVSEWITDDTGTLVLDEKLPSGDYALVETLSPDGYEKYSGTETFVVDGVTYIGQKFTVDNTTTTKQSEDLWTMTVELEDDPSKGRIQIYKTGDALIGSHNEDMTADQTYETTTFDFGYAALPGVTFKVYAAEDIIGKPTIDPTKLDNAIQDYPDKDDLLYSAEMVVWKAKYLTDRVYYNKGDEVTQITTGSDGKATTCDLYLGKYKLVEVGAPEGYTIDSTPIEVELTYQGQEVMADANIESTTMNDVKQNGEITLSSKQIEKNISYYQDNDKVRINKQIMSGGNGIFFGLYANEDIKAVDGTVAAAKDTLIEIIEIQGDGSGKTAKEIPNGKYYIQEISTYEPLVLDTKKYPVEYTGSGNDRTLQVKVNNGASVFNRSAAASVTVKKKTDGHNSEAIPGCKYRFYDEDQKTVIFEGTTDANGEILIKAGEDAVGMYGLGVGTFYVQEYEAPEGIILDTTMYPIVISKDNKTTSKIEVGQGLTDVVVMGDINIEKDGEDTVNIKVDENGQTQYEMIPLEGTKFAIRATEDIIPATGKVKAYKGDIVAYCTTDADGKATPTEYSFMDAEMAAERAADKTPIDLTKSTDSRIMKETHAFLGKYDVYEVEVDEKYRLDTNIYNVELKAIDNATELVSAKVEIDNYCKKGDVEITKTDIATDETIANTSVRIYRDGSVIFEGKTDADGKITLKDLPVGKYSYQEYEAPDGVLVDDGIVEFEITDYGVTKATIKDELSVGKLTIEKTGEDTIHYTVDANGQTQYVQIPIAGVKFKAVAAEDIVSPTGVVKAKAGDTVGYAVTDADGSALFDDCTFMTQVESKARTDSTPQDLTKTATQTYEGLYLGKYQLYEIETTELYRLSEEVHDVEITFTEKVKYINVGNDWTNYCKKGDVEITKTDIATDETLPNCGIRIWNDRGIIFEGYTDENGKITLKDLPIGKYRYQEFDAAEGTLINEDIYDFEIKDGEVTKAEIKDEVALGTAGIIKRGDDREDWKVDENGVTQYEQKPMEGVKFELIAAEDIVSPTGVVKAKKGDIVAYTITDENGKAEFDEYFFMTQKFSEDRSVEIEEDLTKVDPEDAKESERNTQTFAGAYFGKYIIKEAEKVEDYRLNETEYEIELEYQDDKTAIVEAASVLIDNAAEKGDAVIHKTDVSTGKALSETGVRIYDEDKNIIFEGRTDENGDITIRLLPTGKYYYQEFDAPDGYQMDESLFEFEIKDGEVTKCGMTNEMIPKTGITGGTATLIIVAALVAVAAAIIVLRVKARKAK